MACAYQVYVCVWESGCRGMLGMLAWLHVWDTSVMKWLNRMTQTQASMCLLLKWDCVTRSFFAASQGYRMERWISLEMSFCTRETTSYLFLCVYICVLVPICPPGQERFGNMTRVYYREAMGAFIVFDVTRPASFEAVTKWKEDLDSKLTLANGKHVATVLLANKCDQGRDVLTNNGIKMEQFCQENGFVGWYETSAKVRKMTHTHTHTSYTASRIVPIAFNRSSEVFAGVSSSSNVFEKQLTPDRLDCVRPSTWFPCGEATLETFRKWRNPLKVLSFPRLSVCSVLAYEWNLSQKAFWWKISGQLRLHQVLDHPDRMSENVEKWYESSVFNWLTQILKEYS